MNIEYMIKNTTNDELLKVLKKFKIQKKIKIITPQTFFSKNKIAFIIGSEVDYDSFYSKFHQIIENYINILTQEQFDEITECYQECFQVLCDTSRSEKTYTHYWKAPKIDDNDITNLKEYPIIYTRDSSHELKIKNWIHNITGTTRIVEAYWNISKKDNILNRINNINLNDNSNILKNTPVISEHINSDMDVHIIQDMAGHERSDKILSFDTSNIFIIRNNNQELNILEGIDYIQYSALINNKNITIFDSKCNEISNTLKGFPIGIEIYDFNKTKNLQISSPVIHDIPEFRSSIKYIDNDSNNKKKIENTIMTKSKKKKIIAKNELANKNLNGITANFSKIKI